MRGRVVAVEGASASGKSTAVLAVAERLGARVVPEAFRRLRPSPSLEYAREAELLELERTLLEEDGRRFAESLALARSGALVLADTGFLGPITYAVGLVELATASGRTVRALLERARQLSAEGRWGLPDGTVYLRTAPHLQYARARADPTGHPARLVARHFAVGEIERRLYEDRIGPLFGDRYREVSGDGGHDRVARDLASAVRAVASGTARSPTPERVFTVLERSAAAAASARGNR